MKSTTGNRIYIAISVILLIFYVVGAILFDSALVKILYTVLAGYWALNFHYSLKKELKRN